MSEKCKLRKMSKNTNYEKWAEIEIAKKEKLRKKRNYEKWVKNTNCEKYKSWKMSEKYKLRKKMSKNRNYEKRKITKSLAELIRGAVTVQCKRLNLLQRINKLIKHEFFLLVTILLLEIFVHG